MCAATSGIRHMQNLMGLSVCRTQTPVQGGVSVPLFLSPFLLSCGKDSSRSPGFQQDVSPGPGRRQAREGLQVTLDLGASG